MVALGCDHPKGVAGPSCPVLCLGLRPRVLYPLQSRGGYSTVGDLALALHRDQVAGLRNVGPVALWEIRAALVACGVVNGDHEENGVGEPVAVLAWVVREYYDGDANAALVDLARLAGPTLR